MRKVVEVGAIGAALGVLLSCSYNPQLVDTSDVVLYQIDAVRAMEPQGPAFNQGLRQGYLDYSDVMSSEYEHSEYWHFAFKAVDSAKGEMVLPDTVESRHLQAGQRRGAVGSPGAPDGGSGSDRTQEGPLAGRQGADRLRLLAGEG